MNFWDNFVIDTPPCQYIISNYNDIRSELLEYIRSNTLVDQPKYVVGGKIIFENGDWNGMIFSGMDGGYFPDEMIKHYSEISKNKCPTVKSFVEKYEGILTNVCVNRITPGTIINPHTENSKKYMRTQIGIQCDPKCYLEINGERNTWKQDSFLAFEDRKLHNAKHEGIDDLIMFSIDIDLEYLKEYIPEIKK